MDTVSAVLGLDDPEEDADENDGDGLDVILVDDGLLVLSGGMEMPFFFRLLTLLLLRKLELDMLLPPLLLLWTRLTFL